MGVIRYAASRRTQTPNAIMTTLASPTQGGAGRALWRVDMRPGQAGPPHVFDSEQVWTVLDGSATVQLDGRMLAIEPGDTVVMPAGVPRQVIADPEAGFAAIVTGPAGARASSADGTDTGVPSWIA